MAEVKHLSIVEFAQVYPQRHDRIEPTVLVEPIVVHTAPHRVEADFIIDRGRTSEAAGTYVFLDGLEVTGSVINHNGDFGVTLVVEGEMRAQNIVAGGAFIYLDRAVVPGIVLGHYNHGMLQVRDLRGDLTLSLDHDMAISPRGQRGSVSDFPSSGREVYVDDTRLNFALRLDTQARALASWFGGTPYIEMETHEPEELDDILLEGDYQIAWMDWAMTAIRAGAPATDDTFARFVSHMRTAYRDAAAHAE